MEGVLNQLLEKLTKALGDRLVSVVLYGSAVTGDHHEGFSDLNVLCVLTQVTARELADVEPVFRWWREKKNPAPLLLSEHEVQTSTDCFAIEFHDIKNHHRILQGKDVISSLVVDGAFYRAQVEHDLRAKLLRLRAVRFDANVAPGLPWKFEPEQTEIEVKIGQVVTVFYNVTNQSARTTTGQAAYNVAPLSVGAYFQKLNCFCFTEQTMAAGEKREMPVVFYVDPALVKDSDNDGLNTITLSYTFYPVREPAPKPLAASEPDKARGNLKGNL